MNRADGFSPGSMMITKVPGLETAERRRRAASRRSATSRAAWPKRSPVVVINARTGKRHPVWAEIDSNPPEPADRVLIIRPGKNLDEGERYIVALRNLKNGERPDDPGRAELPPLPRPAIQTGGALVERRRQHFEELFRKLRKAGRRRRNLYLAWDFTVASRESLTGRALHIRDQAFARARRQQPG